MAEPRKSENPFLEGSVIHLLHRARQIADELVKSELDKLKVTPRQFTLLIAIEANSGATQVELVNVTGIDRSTMTEMTRRLVVRGLIDKTKRADDSRANTLKLSPVGKRLLKQCRSAVQQGEEKFLERVSTTRRKSLKTILTAVISEPKTVGRPRLQKNNLKSTD